MHRLVVPLLLIASAAAAFAAGTAEPARSEGIPSIEPLVAEGERLSVVATTTILGDVAAAVIGDAADLAILMSRGQNPHAYEPAPRDLMLVEEADLVLVNGLELEEGLLDQIDAVARGPIVPLSAGVNAIEGGHDHDDADDHDDAEHEDDHHVDDHADAEHEDADHDHDDDDHADETAHDHAGGDPHVWTDPASVVVWTENLVRVLSAADPANAAGYEERGRAYLDRLEELDSELRSMFASIPDERRKIVSDHESFSYLARAYGFETIGAIVPGTSDSAEPSAGALADLVGLLEAEGVRAIFVGVTASRGLTRTAEAIAAELGEDVAVVSTLTGSLAAPGERGDTYLDFMRYNAEQIVGGLSR
jgi:ABC-type Zn uptake system ZnuABC Zn-binding protein ZnuA